MPIHEFRCRACGEVSSILFLSAVDRATAPRCQHCGDEALDRLVSRPGLVRGTRNPRDGALRPVDPRRAVENVARQYDASGLDPGRGFEEVAKRAAAGDHPEALKEAVTEARRSEASPGPPSGRQPTGSQPATNRSGSKDVRPVGKP